MIISFSGIDSSGKSTQIRLLEDYFNNNQIKYVKRWGKIRGTPGIVFLKRLVRNDKKMSKEGQKEYREKIYSNSFKQKLLINLALLDFILYFGFYYRILNLFNRYIICDRYIWDSYIEVKTEFNLVKIDKNLLWIVSKFIVPKPKYSFIFVIPAEVSLERDYNKQDPSIDNIELKKSKIQLYEKLIDDGKWNNIISGMDSISFIHAKIKEILKIDN